MKKSTKIIYCCQTCGCQTPKWMGKCPDCGTWDSIVEERSAGRSFRDAHRSRVNQQSTPVAIDSIELETDNRLLTDIREFDRVLGGG
ncbi:MAG: DNA repair protein RadA, partial [Desulfobacterales bacterium]|nr:DNA repair protein RadA [Desulfobacterales bacterium]